MKTTKKKMRNNNVFEINRTYNREKFPILTRKTDQLENFILKIYLYIISKDIEKDYDNDVDSNKDCNNDTNNNNSDNYILIIIILVMI